MRHPVHPLSRILRLFSLVAITLVWGGLPAASVADEVVLADFEGRDYGEWQAEGDAFGDRPATGTLAEQQAVSGYRGKGLVNTYREKDASTGTLTSPEFTVSADYLSFLIGGGELPNEVGIELLINEQRVRVATGRNSETLKWRSWDVGDYRGLPARLRIFDRASGGWGHINVDHVALTDTPRSGFDTHELEQYRQSDQYLAEPLRPHYHFSPEINWLNDPNGLVYFEDEYHLFYQYNPLGNTWGHMSWGHAVSPDLVHWEHLPLAIPEDEGVMIFSGSIVVDRENSSGFGLEGSTPLVAIYTAHQPGNQSQALAFSNDRGRSWTKYADNPVIDIGHADFRDPKVFWHPPSDKWIMVVALANERRVQFYASVDLKQWQLLSEFGPWGAEPVPNWECPDLFLSPVEGSDSSRWVLLISVGSGAVAGGSGSQYFVGDFDGQRFIPDTERNVVQWVDYGADFYAAHRWVNLPATENVFQIETRSQSRPIWIGWMNNWQTNLLPTARWRGEMSLPREVSLRQHAGGYRLIQRPIEQIATLRSKHTQTNIVELQAEQRMEPFQNFSGVSYELDCSLRLNPESIAGIAVRTGNEQETLVEYDVASRSLSIDRRRSGEVDFHPAFGARHSAPLIVEGESLELRIFVDTTSIEVFAEDGQVVFTERIFPEPSSNGLEVFCRRGAATFQLNATQLNAVDTLARPPAFIRD